MTSQTSVTSLRPPDEALSLAGTWAYKGILSSGATQAFMAEHDILAPGESVDDLLSRLLAAIRMAERDLAEDPAATDQVVDEFQEFLAAGVCTLGTPLLTNVARKGRTWTSCSAVPVSPEVISQADFALAEAYYELNMGSGFNLTGTQDPSAALLALNAHADQVQRSGLCERYVGNIAHIQVEHPRILDFIALKQHRNDLVHFNTSIDLSHRFMRAVRARGTYELIDGTAAQACEVWEALSEAAWRCGDPGIISLDRYNEGNALALYFPYTTTAPCAEVGLADGEACVFAYVNLAACIRGHDRPWLDLDLIDRAATCLTQILDDAVQLSLAGFPAAKSRQVMAAGRKIGIGVCGFADLLLWLGVDYGSEASERLLRMALSTINFASKRASVALARRRGWFPAFPVSRYATDPALLARFHHEALPTTARDWGSLAWHAQRHGLRNVMTAALPPSGRSARLLGVNPSIEPYLNAPTSAPGIAQPLRSLLNQGAVRLDGTTARVASSKPSSWWPVAAATPTSLFRSAVELDADAHLRITTVAARLVDDSVSKTINLPATATVADVQAIFQSAWDAGLKAMAIYRMR